MTSHGKVEQIVWPEDGSLTVLVTHIIIWSWEGDWLEGRNVIWCFWKIFKCTMDI